MAQEDRFNSGSESTGLDVADWARKVEKLGPREISLTGRDVDGTKEEYDLEMTKTVAEAVAIPVTPSGGPGKLEHFCEATAIGKAAAALAALSPTSERFLPLREQITWLRKGYL